VTTPREDRDDLREAVEERLLSVNRVVRRYRRLNTALLLVSLILGGLATLFAGVVAKGGALASEATQVVTGLTPKQELPAAWQRMCLVIAVLSFFATMASGVRGGFKLDEQQARAMGCAGLLDSMMLELLSIPNDTRGWERVDKVRADLARAVREYPEFFLD
jgi:hypothetical protein